MDREAALRSHYDAFAEEYAGIDQSTERILSRIEIPPESSILDIGCATGNLTLRLPERGSPKRAVGIDLSGKALSIAKEHAWALSLQNLQFLCASARHLPFGEEEFDIVVSNIVFHLIPDQQNALAEVVRVLKPSGAAVLQFLGGGDVTPEMVEVVHNAWSEILPSAEPPQIFYKLTVEMAEKYLTNLEIDDFEIVWRRRVMRIGDAKIQRFLEFFRLVGSFWRWGLDTEVADRIENLIAGQVMSQVASEGHFTNTVNHLLIEFTKPSK
jgi:ubiquinone/menaquinone biosynthesis C-methylase UbiE